MSCSDDDNEQMEEESVENVLLGTWAPVNFVIICESGATETIPLSECIQNSRITISANSDDQLMGTYQDFPHITINNECVEQGEISGTWELNENIITFTVNTVSMHEIINLSENGFMIRNINSNPYQFTPCSEDDTGFEYIEFTKIQ
ncbi:MAG: lipocalin family protein [Bacteroidetes bacterium]|nr:lipocalin family protein [Bacteroidota bacterium]